MLLSSAAKHWVSQSIQSINQTRSDASSDDSDSMMRDKIAAVRSLGSWLRALSISRKELSKSSSTDAAALTCTSLSALLACPRFSSICKSLCSGLSLQSLELFLWILWLLLVLALQCAKQLVEEYFDLEMTQ